MTDKRQHIVVTTDFSEEAATAFAPVKEQAELRGRDNVRVTILSIVEDLVNANIQFDFGHTVVDTTALVDEAETQAREQMQAICRDYFPELEPETRIVRTTRPVHLEIIDFAKDEDADLIVISTHGRSGLSHLLDGSVTEKLLRETPCPVLVVPIK